MSARRSVAMNYGDRDECSLGVVQPGGTVGGWEGEAPACKCLVAWDLCRRVLISRCELGLIVSVRIDN